MTTGFRTLFLAREPTWDGWLDALKKNWVVAVRHDAVSGIKTWMHGGSAEVVDFVRQHETRLAVVGQPGDPAAARLDRRRHARTTSSRRVDPDAA